VTDLPQVPVNVSPKQLDYLRNSRKKFNLCDGSIRAGKTLVTLLRWVLFIARAPRGGELVMIGRTRDAIWRNLIMPLQDPALFGPIAAAVVGNVGAPTVMILGRRVHLIGASDAKAEKTIRGMTVAGAYVDEITVVPEEVFTQLIGRMSVPGSKMFGSTNPDNPAHWFKTKFLDRLDKLTDWAHWRFTMDDNPSLTEEYKRTTKAAFTGLWYRRFILGDWVAAEGAVYPMWDPDKHVTPWENLPYIESLLAVGVDYGTNNPTTGLLLGLSRELDERGDLERRRLVLVDEFGTEQGHGSTDAQLSKKLRSFAGTGHLLNQPDLRPEHLIIDPSAASFKTQLWTDGATNLVNAVNDVAYGIRTTATLLGNGQLVVSDRCRGFIREISGYSWDDDAAKKGDEKPIKVADHYLDGARYAITTTETLWSDLIRATPIAA